MSAGASKPSAANRPIAVLRVAAARILAKRLAQTRFGWRSRISRSSPAVIAGSAQQRDALPGILVRGYPQAQPRRADAGAPRPVTRSGHDLGARPDPSGLLEAGHTRSRRPVSPGAPWAVVPLRDAAGRGRRPPRYRRLLYWLPSQRRRDPTDSDAADQRRDETPAEQLDRNTIELLNELRVAATGILVLTSDVVFGGAVTHIVGVVAGGSIATLWFVVPLNRRRHV